MKRCRKSLMQRLDAEQLSEYISDPASSNKTSKTTKSNMNYRNLIYSNPFSAIVDPIGPMLLLFATCFIIASPSVQDNPKPGAAITPTVIVRGFLNYRTTVDGTVLLFTPDAGGSSTVRSVTTTAHHQHGPSTQPIPIAGGSSVISEPYSEVGSSVEVPVSATPVMHTPEPTRRDSEPIVGDVVDEHWRPVIATPPLRPTFLKDQLGLSTESSQEDHSKPTVQADDVSPASETASQPKQPAKFKRPNVAGSGSQSIRARFSGPSTSSSSSSGLRRPSLIGSPPTTEPNVPNAFQVRLNQASAKLRNRFKKQPTSPSSAGKPNAPEPIDMAQDQSTASSSTENSAVEFPSSSSAPSGSSSPTVGSDEVLEVTHSEKPEPRFGDQSPASNQHDPNSSTSSNGLQQGQLGLMSAGLSDSFFMGDEIPFGNQAGTQSAESSEHSTSHDTPVAWSHSHNGSGSSRKHSNNDKLNGWLDQHHNRFVQRPPKQQQQESGSSANKHLAASLNTLTPSFSTNIGSGPNHSQIKSTPVLQHAPGIKSSASSNSTTGEVTTNALITLDASALTNSSVSTDQASMKTVTRVYSTVMTSASTRVVPMQVQSSAIAVTITEQYVITKMLTAYQTLPVGGEFLVASDELSTKGPMAMLADPQTTSNNQQQEQPISTNALMPAAASSNDISTQEQPISFDANKKSPTDWLHDFSSDNFNDLSSQPQQQLMQQLLSQQAFQGNLQVPAGEPLDQLASTLNPSSLLAVGNIPDLNNPLVLAAAIQNPQLAAIILAAQQIQLKQRAKLAQQQHLLQGAAEAAQNQMALQPSYSTNLVTAIKPSVYTVRDTMYTTRLVSFKDGRIMRTRTVSEPGSVVEQVLTTSVTEVTPVTVTIKPSGVLTGASVPMTAVAGFGGPGSAPQLNSAQINNALIATQLAQLLARRQQQVQPSFLSQAQHLLNSNQQQQQQSLPRQPANSFQPQQQAAKQFQPNIQQLLASIQQQGDQQQQQPVNNPVLQQQQNHQSSTPNKQPIATPPLPTGPIVTTLTNLQVRTYTVHNAFKVIYRTITSTQLVTSTIMP